MLRRRVLVGVVDRAAVDAPRVGGEHGVVGGEQVGQRREATWRPSGRRPAPPAGPGRAPRSAARASGTSRVAAVTGTVELGSSDPPGRRGGARSPIRDSRRAGRIIARERRFLRRPRTPRPGAEDPDLARARDGDDAAFTRLVEPLRRELHAHCYRMLGSTHDADDALQDALLRAWRGLARFEGRSSLRSWLYTVATRTCLDAVDGRGRRALPVDLGPSSDRAVVGDAPLTDVAWLGPYPDAGLADGRPARTRATSSARPSSWPSSPRCSTCRATSGRRCCCSRCSASPPPRSPP